MNNSSRGVFGEAGANRGGQNTGTGDALQGEKLWLLRVS